MLIRLFAAALVSAGLFISSPAMSQDATTVRNTLAGAVGGTLCAEAGPWARWCAALGVAAAYWVDKGVSLVIDRHFEAKDQDFANKNKITICYKDGKCIKPK